MTSRPSFFLVCALGLALLASAARAATVTLTPSKDNTLYEDPNGSLSSGSGSGMFVGRTAIGSIRRAVVAFDVAGAVPANSRIDRVTLRLRMTRTRVGAEPVGLHRLLADWGEGGSSGSGSGGASAPGDATWIHTFFPSSFWASAGGDFVPVASAVIDVAGFGDYTWGSTAGMVADVQRWLDDPAGNFGWLLRGNEGTFPTTKRFETREGPSPPSLEIEFDPPTRAAPRTWGAIKALYR